MNTHDIGGEEFGRDAEALWFDPVFAAAPYSFDPWLVPDPQGLANRLVRNIDAWEGDLSAMLERWDTNEAMYRADPAYVAMQAVDGMEPYPVPLSRIKCDNTVGSLVSTFTASEPYATIDSANDPETDAQRERANTKLAKEAKIERALAGALWCAWLYNLGIVRIVPTVSKTLDGIESGWIDPRDFCIYPSKEQSALQARTVGHRFYEPRWEIERRMEEGVWAPCNVFGKAGQRDREANMAAHPMGEPSTSDAADDAPELWELETHERTPKGWVRLRCTICRNPARLLRVDRIGIGVSHYATFRLVDNERELLTKDSLAEATQGMGLAASDVFTAWLQTALGKATPIVAIIGGKLGPERAKRVTWGEIWDDLEPGTQIQQINPGGDISDLRIGLEKIEQLFDAVTGVSRAASNQSLPTSTTATAINALAQADARGQSRMLSAATDGWEQCLQILDALWIYEYPRWVKLYGEKAVGCAHIESVRPGADVASTARALGSPQSVLQKLQALWEMAKDPVSGLDPSKVAHHVVQALDLSFDPEDVKGKLMGGVPVSGLAAGLGGGAGQPGVPPLPDVPPGPVEPNPALPGQPVA